MAEVSFVSDQRESRLVGGLTAAVSIFFGVILVFLLPLGATTRINIFLVLIGLVIFTGVYFMVPTLFKNKHLDIIPGLVYVIGLAGIVHLAGHNGYFFVLFYLLLIAVAAFVYRLLEYFFVVTLSVVGVLVATLVPDLIMEAEYLVGLYMIFALAVLLRCFANSALKTEAEKNRFAQEAKDLEADKGEIRNLLESLSDGLIWVNADNKITFINPSALRVLGITVGQVKVLGRDVNDYLPTIGHNGPEPITREVFGSLSHSIRNDFRIVMPQKTIRLHTNISPIIADGAKLKGAVILFRDITDEQRADDQRAEFNAIASHELRTPLSVIEGYLYYVLDPSSKLKYDKETAEYIKRAHEAATDLNSLVTDILTVVKSDQGELEVNLKKINPVAFLEKLAHSFEDEAEAKKIKLTFEVVAHDKIPDIVTDPVKLKEVASNIICNAIKFTEKGSVKVEVGLLKKELIVNVTDTGAGVSNTDQAGIFNKFYRAENWQTRKTSGTGLGLYIAKNLVERLGGRIGVKSVLGRGSTFHFTLPLDFQSQKTEEIN